MALHDYLRNKRYLIVVEDVIASDVWDYIGKALPDHQNGSRVLSYHNLCCLYTEMVSTIPLKLCRLYLSAFEIFTRQLYQLWIAEGFIPDNSEKTAEEYLEQLISSGFIKVKKRRARDRSLENFKRLSVIGTLTNIDYWKHFDTYVHSFLHLALEQYFSRNIHPG
ncbi:hypothetical protein WN944_023525 [Citrus x changshan-huyou]|uniref:NB-ARC domain-containing protein n=1 Tax=Citrus x changshan-huyou TaxID=2935761 RepID=A0AAP0N5V1_9ROSI